MEMMNLSLPATNKFASSYLEQSAEILPFFHYRYNQLSDYKNRLKELENRTFPRKVLGEHIEAYMSRFPSSPAVKSSIEKLKQENSAVIIGGQQAGILTGPLYTIHKVISIIKMAEQKETELGIPVVPVFWIAGEDHDFQEVNHVFVPVGQKADKWIYPERVLQKKMVSDITIDEEICLSWAQNLIKNFGETDHTNSILEMLEDSLKQSESFTDFFATVIMEFYKDYGLLIIDSANPNLREIEKEFFEKQINHHDSITVSLLEQQREISKKGFSLTLEATENAANIFYYEPMLQERILLEYDRTQDRFIGKNGVLSFSKKELIRVLADSPERLSNNVVTRPLMQDFLFPTLGFIAGPGEIAYWAELKKVFEHFEIKMPPIIPRLNITLLDRSVETDIEELELELAEVLQFGTSSKKDAFLESIKDKEVEELFTSARDQLTRQYLRIEEKTGQLDKGLLPLLKKNKDLLIKQISFMEGRLERSVKMQHETVLEKFSRIDLALRPEGSPQERIWNIFWFINKYGLDFVHSLMELSYEFDGNHKVIKL
ncbi:bacillithiol biosynthesis cysteine-adding enzyme BshC [Neobacillus terrae]|uniref:bacillithiol biosynthesis cysteine-adding enzyme BshC n=1 Tax=Neobacillus terrae TaxID=3034837 RepID=UPI001407EC59|nr:bacillithiol biosynthesis cysteine-adding enzyme BshC [Neobacillus terrae]NHM29692.1 bacillithiol biosynthesis cysteine-adding enzyme BshC [Neobacillus terrae]